MRQQSHQCNDVRYVGDLFIQKQNSYTFLKQYTMQWRTAVQSSTVHSSNQSIRCNGTLEKTDCAHRAGGRFPPE